MKYLASFIFALCFAASMVSCKEEEKINEEATSSLEVSAVTELDSSSEAESSLEIDSSTAETEVETGTAVTETDSIETTSSSKVEETTVPKITNGQLVETTIEEIVVKPVETTIVVNEPIIQSEETIVSQEVVVTPSIEIDSYSYQLLAEIVEHESGCSWISIYNKAHVAAAVMNRVYDNRFPNTVYDVLTQPGQCEGYWPGCITPGATAYEAVDYYLANPYEFDNSNSWWGDSYQNYFYYQ